MASEACALIGKFGGFSFFTLSTYLYSAFRKFFTCPTLLSKTFKKGKYGQAGVRRILCTCSLPSILYPSTSGPTDLCPFISMNISCSARPPIFHWPASTKTSTCGQTTKGLYYTWLVAATGILPQNVSGLPSASLYYWAVRGEMGFSSGGSFTPRRRRCRIFPRHENILFSSVF